MTIPPTTDPRQAAFDARELAEYALMHPSVFDERERMHLNLAIAYLMNVCEKAREIC